MRLPGLYTLVIKNGEINSNGKVKHAVTNARIYVNDVQIFKPKHFNKKVHHLEAQVDLNENNILKVKLRGKKAPSFPLK